MAEPIEPVDSVDELPTSLQMSGVRPFSMAATNASIDEALAQLPPDASGAVVLYGEQRNGETVARLAYAANLGDGWSAMVEVDADKKSGARFDLGAKAIVRKVW